MNFSTSDFQAWVTYNYGPDFLAQNPLMAMSTTWTVPAVPYSDDGQSVMFFSALGIDQELDQVIASLLVWSGDTGWIVTNFTAQPGTAELGFQPLEGVAVAPGDTVTSTLQMIAWDPGDNSKMMSPRYQPRWEIAATADSPTQSVPGDPVTGPAGNTDTGDGLFNYLLIGTAAHGAVSCEDYPEQSNPISAVDIAVGVGFNNPPKHLTTPIGWVVNPTVQNLPCPGINATIISSSSQSGQIDFDTQSLLPPPHGLGSLIAAFMERIDQIIARMRGINVR